MFTVEQSAQFDLDGGRADVSVELW